MPSVNTRIFFSKTDRAKYISHLDLYGVFQRAARRSRLPFWYTEGYNPRLYLQFLLPLSLGQEGLREALDCRVLGEAVRYESIAERLNIALPPDIRVLRAAKPIMRNTDIAYAEYEISGEINLSKFEEFLASEAIPAEKKTKRGAYIIDLKPYITNAEISDRIRLRLPVGTALSLNPSLLIREFERRTGEKIPRIKVVRTEIFAENGRVFE